MKRFLFLLLLSHSLKAEPTPQTASLFLLPKEIKKTRASPHSGVTVLEGMAALYLGSLLFQGQNHWTLWVNGQRITSDEDLRYKLPQGLKIDDVSESQVIFSLSLWKNRPPERIALSPNQTYLVEVEEIWEGDQRPQE